MKKNTLYKFLSITSLLFASSVANASITLGFGAPVQTANSFDVEVTISGLGDGFAPSLSSYDLDIEFDTSHIQYANVTLGDPVLGNQLDLFDFGLNPSGAGLSTAGVLNIYEISLDDALDLNEFQADIFTLATLSFNVLKSGSSELSFLINDLGDADGNILAANTTTASVVSVPVPTAFWLMASGLVGLYRKRV